MSEEEPGFRYLPSPAPEEPLPEVARLTVDGEVFVVREGPGERFDYGWITGPNEGYGFSAWRRTVTRSGVVAVPHGASSLEDHRAAISEFLSGIDPATGYLAD